MPSPSGQKNRGWPTATTPAGICRGTRWTNTNDRTCSRNSAMSASAYAAVGCRRSMIETPSLRVPGSSSNLRARARLIEAVGGGMQERPPAARSWRFASRSMLGAIPDAGPARVEAYAVTKGAEAPTFDAEMQQRAVKPLHTPAPVRARLFEAGLLSQTDFLLRVQNVQNVQN